MKLTCAPTAALVSVLLAIIVGTAQAQDPTASWQPILDNPSGFQGAGVCPVNDADTGDVFCVMLGCQPRGLAYARFSFFGGSLPERVMATRRSCAKSSTACPRPATASTGRRSPPSMAWMSSPSSSRDVRARL